MDFHALQQKLFALDPTDPREDFAKMKAAAQGGAAQAPVQEDVDYLQESAEVPEGSLGLDKDYSVSDFAALAGVVTEGKQRTGSAGQAKGKDPMPKTSKPSTTGEQPHPLKDKLVGEASEDRIAALEARVAQLEEMLAEKSVSKAQQQAAGIALAAKRKGEKPKGDGAAAQMYKMSTDDLEDFASTKHKGLPKKKKTTETDSIKEQLLAMLRDK